MDLIDRQALLKQIDIDSDGEPGYYGDTWKFIDTIKSMPSATDTNVGTKLGIDPYKIGRAIRGLTEWQKHVQTESDIDRDISVAVEALKAQLGTDCIQTLKELPSTQPTFDARDTQYNLPIGTDLISRVQAIDALCHVDEYNGRSIEAIRQLPSAQPERRCVNCGRTVNNGGWYEDGRTRCPIEEHYALPKDGYCHLWEKRKDWEDDYVKRAEEGEK